MNEIEKDKCLALFFSSRILLIFLLSNKFIKFDKINNQVLYFSTTSLGYNIMISNLKAIQTRLKTLHPLDY
jgi:hypothetical protein